VTWKYLTNDQVKKGKKKYPEGSFQGS
jgi:hypothetical protein